MANYSGNIPDIQFTMEEEENNQLAFLDVLGHSRQNGSQLSSSSCNVATAADAVAATAAAAVAAKPSTLVQENSCLSVVCCYLDGNKNLVDSTCAKTQTVVNSFYYTGCYTPLSVEFTSWINIIIICFAVGIGIQAGVFILTVILACIGF
ncbi:hypothetical protein SprV_0902757500 [Sparganum proliferum]